MKAAVAHSDDPLGSAAARSLVETLERDLEGATPALLLVFASQDTDHEAVLGALVERWPGVPLAGCTTDGEGSSLLGFQQDSVCALALAGSVEARLGLGRDAAHDVDAAAEAAVRQAREAGPPAPPSLCLLFPQTLTSSSARAVAAVGRALGPEVPIFGAAPADDQRFDRPRQFCGGAIVEDAVLLVLLWGDVAFGYGVGSGFSVVGRQSRVTRASGSVVYEIDGEPALRYYQEYLGELLQPSNEYPVALYVGEDVSAEASCVRTPIAGHPEDGSVTFAGDVPEGAVLRFAEGSRDAVLAAADSAVREARAGLSTRPVLALFFSCAGRRELLGTRAAEEAAQLRRALPGVPFCGFYGFGEVGPLGRRAGLHNETFVCLVFGDGGGEAAR